MPTAKKLPSGSWRCQVFSHTEKTWDEKTERWKEKRIYESFTSTDPSKNGKKEAELAAAEFSIQKRTAKSGFRNMTLHEAIEKHITSSDSVLSPSTINGYRIIQRNGFKPIMHAKLKDLTPDVLQDAVNNEAKTILPHRAGKKISPKTVKNRYGLITAVLNKYMPTLSCTVRLPAPEVVIKEMPDPADVFNVFRGDRLELAVLLAMWLSFTMSEVKGLTKSKSIDGENIVIREVVVTVGTKEVRKVQAKNKTRTRMHHIPPYIKDLIDKVEGDVIVPYTSASIYNHFVRKIKSAGLPKISFHDLRHLNASVMAMLQVSEKYAMERGGWKTDAVMKKVYTHTFAPERERVDNVIDDYFKKIIDPEEKEAVPEELLKILTENPEGWKEALLKFMQHEMQHENKKSP